MATIRAVTGRHLSIEIVALADDQPAALDSLRCTILDKPGGMQLLDQTMTLQSPGVYTADFGATSTAVLVDDAAFEVSEFDPAGDVTDLTPLIGGVVLVSRPGDGSAVPLLNHLTVNVPGSLAADVLPGTLVDNGDGTVTVNG